jgi:hypothetical protein
MQYTRCLGIAYTLRRCSWLSWILTLPCAIWTELKDANGRRASLKSALTGSRTYVADIAYAQAPLLTILPFRSFSPPIRHMYRTLKAFVACGAYAERRAWSPLAAKYR